MLPGITKKTNKIYQKINLIRSFTTLAYIFVYLYCILK